MQTEQSVKEELQKVKNYKEKLWHDPVGDAVANAIISTLEWVLEGGELKFE